MSVIRFPFVVFLSAFFVTQLLGAADDAPKQSTTFDQRIAPLLARHCLDCHNAAAKKGGLDLSREAAARDGGDSGVVIAGGKPDESVLWERVSNDEMPPKHPLSADEKQVLRKWIATGAKWGTDPIDPFRFTTDKRAGYNWWSLQPVKQPIPPKVSGSSPDKSGFWPRNEIDHFVLAKLKAAGLTPAEQADARTLVRRLYFDLIGLPPSPEEVEQWTARLNAGTTNSHINEQAYRELVDELLASPHYGERWARHWLDVIRFGESQGFERNRIRENAWRYRDWVIHALNRDMPYNEFVRQQIAGDALYPDELDPLLATGFLVCGTWDQVGHNEGSAEMQKAVRQEELEDLVGATGQAFLGLTINCARCHDHKFDPISQRDYYQFAALLGGVTQQEKERQNIPARPSNDAHRKWEQRRNEVQHQLADLEQKLRDRYGKSSDGNPIDGLLALYLPEGNRSKLLHDASGLDDSLDLAASGKVPFATSGPAIKLIAGCKESNELTVEAWLKPTKDNQSGPARIVTLSLDTGQRNFTLGQDGNRFDFRLRTSKTDQNGLPSLATPNGTATRQNSHVVYTFDRGGTVRAFVNGKQVASRRMGGDFSNWNDKFRLAFANELTGDRPWEGELDFVAIYRRALSAEEIARNWESQSRDVRVGEPFDELLAKASKDQQSRHNSLQRELQQLNEAEPARPFNGVAHVVIPKQPPVFHVLARGNYGQPGEVVAPRGLNALTHAGLSDNFDLAPNAPEAKRRIELARWMADARNPLTPRVLVNRLWHYHFGQGIVNTPSDFGFAGGRPSHPELLDWLASRFVAGGWKIKPMHRLIVMSAAYRQVSNVRNNQAQQFDADNTLLWRANARRLDGEATRDAMLSVAGALNLKLGGASYRDVKVKLGTNHEFTDPTGEFNDDVNRRTIYRLWARSGNNPLLESLDCPDPSVAAPRRSQTITPVQSLSLLNSGFVEQCAARLSLRTQREAGGQIDRQIARLYQITLARNPQPRELEIARRFVSKQGLEQLCLVLLNTNEFLFVE